MFVWLFVPETKGISLEAMGKMFGVTEGPSKEASGSEGKADFAREKRGMVKVREAEIV